MSLYETLGVPKDASAEEIKSAFRRNASNHHPDREGGDAKKMAEVNKAYEVLSDPQRRSQYDETGDEIPPASPQSKARALLLDIFSQLLESDSPSLLKEASDLIKQNYISGDQHWNILDKKYKKITRRIGKLKVSVGENYFEAILNQQLTLIKQEMERIREAQEIFQLVTAMLEDWEEEPLQALPPSQQWNQTGISNAFIDAFSGLGYPRR